MVGVSNMSRTLREDKVLKKLDIVDFRHLTKDKVITMASMLDRMDPEVAKKALEQFPEFAQTTKEMLTEYKDTLDKGLQDNKDSVQAYYDACQSIIDSLQKQLEKNDLSFEQRKEIIDQMLEITKMMGIKDSENKKFIVKMAICGAAAVGLTAMALASVLGGNSEISSNDDDNNNIV